MIFSRLLRLLACTAALLCAPSAQSQVYCPDGSCQPGYVQPQQVAQTQRVIHSAHDSYPWVCRLRGSHRDGSWSTGTGSLVYEDEGIAYVLTAKHVIRGVTGRIICHFPDGKAYAARVDEVHSTADLARLAIRPTGITPAQVRDSEPSDGERLWAAGYGGDGRFRAAAGRANYHWQDNLGITEAYVRSGDSGGPVVDSEGRFVAVVWGASHDVNGTMACRWTPVRNILSGVWGRLRNRARSRQQLIDQRQQQLGIGYTQPQAPSGEEAPTSPVGDQDGESGAPGEDGAPDAIQGLQDSLDALAGDVQSVQDRLAALEDNSQWQAVEANREAIGRLEQQVAEMPAEGPAGPEGPPGEASEIDEEQIAERAAEIVADNVRVNIDDVVQQLPPIHFEVPYPDGTVKHYEGYLGGTVRLVLVRPDESADGDN